MDMTASPFGRDPNSGRRRGGSPSTPPGSVHRGVGVGSGEGTAAGHLAPSRPDTPDPWGLTEKERLKVAFEAISGLAGCIDHLVRDLRRGTTPGQWRTVTDELSRIRRLVAARPETHEGPPRDEGPASQPPSPTP